MTWLTFRYLHCFFLWHWQDQTHLLKEEYNTTWNIFWSYNKLTYFTFLDRDFVVDKWEVETLAGLLLESMLVNKWIWFHFLLEKNTAMILGMSWVIGRGSLVLDRWRSTFNPSKEKAVNKHLWLLFLGFPLKHTRRYTFKFIF